MKNSLVMDLTCCVFTGPQTCSEELQHALELQLQLNSANSPRPPKCVSGHKVHVKYAF